jgi:hypothetical protein
MKIRLKAILVSTTSALAVALVAFSFTLGGTGVGRADDAEALTAARPEMVLVSAKTLDALEQRISYLEEPIASLSQSTQQVTHRICIADDSGAQTCVTKSELDALLTREPRAAETVQGATVTAAETTPPAKEPAAIVPAANNPEAGNPELPTPVVAKEEAAVPESTGAIPVAEPSVRHDAEAVELGDDS